MKIVHLIQQLSRGGAARSMIAIAKYSLRLGDFQHHVISLLPAEPSAVELAREADMTVLNAPGRDVIQREMENADIVHIQFWNNPEIYELLRSELPAIRLLLWFHIAGDKAPQIITKDLVDYSDFTISCNPYSSELLVFQNLPGSVKAKRTGMVYDTTDFARLSDFQYRLHNTFNVGYIGTVDFVKMHANYVMMSAQIDIPNVQFIVCGGGIENYLRQQALQLGVAERFDFRGYVEDIKSVIEVMDVYGYPLCEDTYAAAELNLQEVMYAGVPPVVFPYGGIKRLIVNNYTGLIVHSELEYKQAIEYLYHHPEERTRLGRNAREYAQKTFGAENAARQLNSIYERLMELPKRRRTWGIAVGESLIYQAVSLQDLTGQAVEPCGAELLAQSLGDAAPEFTVSMTSLNIQELFEAERQIAASSPLLRSPGSGGILNYRHYYPNDGYLRLWSGLVLQQVNQNAEAVSEFIAAINLGCNHWRVGWYLAQAAEKVNDIALAEKAVRAVVKVAPDFAEAQEMLERIEESRSESIEESQLNQSAFKVSAIVSTYNSEKFMRGCLQDLTEQTLYKKGELEIIVIDSASEQNERVLVQEFQAKYPNIIYERTAKRETLYAAWNRGIQVARGQYITNANTDDRHRKDALEILSRALDEYADVDLVYGDCYISTTANEGYDDNDKRRIFRYPEYFAPVALVHFQFGPQPMWRKSVHNSIGYFDGSFRAAGDYDFNIRFALKGLRAFHIPDAVGLYLLHNEAISTANNDVMQRENARIAQTYKTVENVEKLYKAAGIPCDTPEDRAKALKDMEIRLREFYPPWYEGRAVSNIPFAVECFLKAAELCPLSKHILLYTDDPGLGGVAHYNHSLLCGLAALGYQLTCVQSKMSDPLVSHRNELGIQHLWLEFDTSKDFERTLTNSADTQKILSIIKPDLIIFSDTWPLANFAAKDVAIQLGIPYIVVVGCVGPYPGGLPSVYLDELSRRYNQAKAVIAVSSENLSLLHQLFGLPKNKGQVIYHGRPAQYFSPPQISVRARLRQEFDIPSDAVVCFTAARLDTLKGYQYQLAAIEQLKQSQVWPLLYFVWAGSGTLETQLRETVKQLGVTDQVKILGQRWDISDWLDASDIFVMPSVLEAFGLAIVEAMAKGLPVIASDVGGIPEVLGDTGRLLPNPKVDPQATVTELAATIQAWCTNPELRDSMGKACKTRAEKLFRDERMVKETVEVIEHALLPVGDYVSPTLSITRELIERTLFQVEDRLVAGGARTVNKKALVFFPHNPYPPRTGAHQRCLAMLSGLKELGYDVTLFGSNLITDSPWPIDHINNLQDDLGVRVEVYQGTQADQQFMAQVSASSRDLMNWDIYTPPGLHERFRQLFTQLAPDVVVINYALWGGLAIGEEFKSAVRIIDTHDLITMSIQMRQALGRYLTTVTFTPDQIDPSLVEEDFFSKLQLDAKPEEYWIYDQYDYTIAIAPREAQAIREHTHQTRVEYVPMTFTTEPLNNTYTSNPLFVVGPNPFNVQGYLYFTTKVLPVVLRQLPEFSLQVVGSSCQQLVPVDGIQLLGFVPDLKPLYSESRFAICPLIGGTGQQVKIVEAMAHGVPVIVLRNVAESSLIQHGINGFIANNAEEFAEYTIQLFREQELCRKLGQAARETIAGNYSKYALLEKLNFLEPDKLQNQPIQIEKILPKIIVDGVFFQLYKTGIARVWRSLLEEWAENGFAKHIVVLDRAGTAPKIPGIRYRPVPPYDYSGTDSDREMLQQVCDEEGADLFISTYYTTAVSTPSVLMVYDMIPEVMVWNLNHPMWQEKHYSIQHASAYIAISENTARDLVKFFPHIFSRAVTVAPCGVKSTFFPASIEEVNSFKTKYGISKPYFILVGTGGYKNTILFFKAFAQLYSRHGFEIVCTGSGSLLEAEFRSYTSGSVVHMLQLSDEELRAAYSGAVALVYPSNYEGFGLPVLEAIACGCPVITCPNASIPEVAGEAALYVNDNDVDGLTDALCDVQKPNVRNSLIAAGLEQAKKFSWSKMAKTVSSALIDATLLPLNLKDINLIVFPDWFAPEESLCFDLERVVRAIATHPDSSQMTLLVYTGNIPDEDAALILSSVTMNLLLQEDLDVSEGLEISLVGQLGEIHWEALLPRIHARIVLENENQGAIAQVKGKTIPSCELDSFSNKQDAQLKPGIWDLTRHSEIDYFNRGIALRDQGKFAEAVSSYQKALDIKPDFAEARYQLSITRYANQIILKGYHFTEDWFSWNVPTWKQHLKRFINSPTLNVLEIGSWEGRSACWLLDNIMTHESNKITCIDTFEGSVEHKYDSSYIQSIEGRFDFNIVKTGAPEKVQKIVGNSHEIMRTLPLKSYDIVYIDGSHIASDVLEDAVLAWQLVKVGGFIIFDDYPFSLAENPAWNTRIGVDAFMSSFSDKFRLIHKSYQVILEKI